MFLLLECLGAVYEDHHEHQRSRVAPMPCTYQSDCCILVEFQHLVEKWKEEEQLKVPARCLDLSKMLKDGVRDGINNHT
jgi:hypothetical protein